MISDKVELIPLQLTHARLREKALGELKHDPFSKYVGDNIKDISNNISWLQNASSNNEIAGPLSYYGIFLREREVFAGEIGIDEFDEIQGVANVFYWVRPQWRNRGVARQAIELLKIEAVRSNVHFLKFMIDKSNFLSERVIRKVGAIKDNELDKEDRLRSFYFLQLQYEEEESQKIRV